MAIEVLQTCLADEKQFLPRSDYKVNCNASHFIGKMAKNLKKVLQNS